MMANGDAFDKQAELVFAEFLICIFVALLRSFNYYSSILVLAEYLPINVDRNFWVLEGCVLIIIPIFLNTMKLVLLSGLFLSLEYDQGYKLQNLYCLEVIP